MHSVLSYLLIVGVLAFGSAKQCKQGSCRTDSEPHCLEEPKIIGNCFAYMRSYSYNSTSGRCESFLYGGCNGNNNLFDDKDECKKTCIEPAKTCTFGSCRADSEPHCVEEPKITGNCLAYMRSYSYNSTSGRCESFIYGGCRGNNNRFDDKHKCEKTCIGSPKTVCKHGICLTRQDPCSETPKQTGMCKANLIRYSFVPKLNKCVWFTYGGCIVNNNNFRSQKACEKKCL